MSFKPIETAGRCANGARFAYDGDFVRVETDREAGLGRLRQREEIQKVPRRTQAMNDRLFRDEITRLKPRLNTRRRWKLKALVALILILLAVWQSAHAAMPSSLFSVLRWEASESRAPGDVGPLELGYFIAFTLVSAAAIILILAVRRWSAKDAAILCADDQIKLILGLEDLRGIIGACRAESRVALLFVEAALTTTDIDDYADALRAAHGKLAQVTKTLGDLQRSLTTANAEVCPPGVS